MLQENGLASDAVAAAGSRADPVRNAVQLQNVSVFGDDVVDLYRIAVTADSVRLL